MYTTDFDHSWSQILVTDGILVPSFGHRWGFRPRLAQRILTTTVCAHSFVHSFGDFDHHGLCSQFCSQFWSKILVFGHSLAFGGEVPGVWIFSGGIGRYATLAHIGSWVSLPVYTSLIHDFIYCSRLNSQDTGHWSTGSFTCLYITNSRFISQFNSQVTGHDSIHNSI